MTTIPSSISSSVAILVALTYGSHAVAATPKVAVAQSKKADPGLDAITSRKEWEEFSWTEPERSRIIKDNSFAEKQSQGGPSYQSSTTQSSIGKIVIDAYSADGSAKPEKIVVNFDSEDATQATCDANQALLMEKFGNSVMTRDVSIPGFMSYISTQWSMKNTVATWTCVGITSKNNKRSSFVTFEDSGKAKLFVPLIPLTCNVRTVFADGDTKFNEYQFVIDQYSDKVRKADNSILTIASDLVVSDQAISFKMAEAQYSATIRINRTTGRYESSTHIPSLKADLPSTGMCEKFNQSVKKF